MKDKITVKIDDKIHGQKGEKKDWYEMDATALKPTTEVVLEHGVSPPPGGRVSSVEARWAFSQDSKHRPGVVPKGGEGTGKAKRKKGGRKHLDLWSGFLP